MYKLIAMDIDGTLLNSYGEVSLKNKEAIELALKKNVEVVLTSGRMPKAILPIASEIKADKYIISGNGAAIYDVQNDKIIYNSYLTKKKVLEIIDICEKNSMFYNVYTNDVILTKSLSYNILFYHNENKRNPEDKKIKINIVDDIYKYVEEYGKEDFLKVTICDNDKFVFRSIMNKMKNIKNVDVLEVAHMSKKIIRHGSEEHEIAYYYTEITNKNVNKWTALKELLQLLGIKKEELITIGDNVNDTEMIENAGLGIVTGNASPEMKKIANKIVSSNNENGVAEAIIKYAL